MIRVFGGKLSEEGRKVSRPRFSAVDVGVKAEETMRLKSMTMARLRPLGSPFRLNACMLLRTLTSGFLKLFTFLTVWQSCNCHARYEVIW